MNNKLEQAKRTLSLAVLMRLLGHGERVRKSALCPFHQDSAASFSVFIGNDGKARFKCHSGCGQGDAIDFLALAKGLSNAEACREFVRLAEGSTLGGHRKIQQQKV